MNFLKFKSFCPSKDIIKKMEKKKKNTKCNKVLINQVLAKVFISKTCLCVCMYIMYVCVCVCELSCLVMSDSLGAHEPSPPSSSVHGIFQARILE